MNFWIKVFQEFCSFPPRAQLSFYCSGYIHFVIFLPLCLLLVIIKYLLLLYSLTSPALLSHSPPPHPHPPSLLQSGYFHSQVKRDRLGIHFSDDFPSSSIRTFPLLSFNSMASHCDSYSSLLTHLSLHFMLSSQTLLLPLHSACWNTRWRRGSGAAVAASVPPGVGVWGVAVGAILTSSQPQWWWSSARCSSARLVPYAPPSLPQSSRGPTKKRQKTWLDCWLYFWSDLLVWGIAITTFNVFWGNSTTSNLRSSVYLQRYTLPRLRVFLKPSRPGLKSLLASASRPQNWVFMHWCVWRFGANVLPWRFLYQWKKCPI